MTASAYRWRCSPAHQAAAGETERREQGGHPVEEQAQRLHLVDKVGQEEPEERDGRERDAQPEHPGGHGQREQSARDDDNDRSNAV